MLPLWIKVRVAPASGSRRPDAGAALEGQNTPAAILPEAAIASRDPRVDAYLDKSAEFARPILAHLRRP